MTDIDVEAKKARSEYFVSRSVVITSETPGFEHGTGVAISYNNEDYILTAAHVLEKEPENEKLLIIGRAGSTLKETSKQELPDYFFDSGLGKIKPSTGTHISIINRLANKALGDIAALKIENAKNNLPHTVFHDLSNQGQTDISESTRVVIFGYPGELHIPHKVYSQIRLALFSYCTAQNIMPFPSFSDSSNPLDPHVDFFTDFVLDQQTCDPKGMSGGGAWTIPEINDSELWTPWAKLVGIQSGIYWDRKLLRFVRIESVLSLLSGN